MRTNILVGYISCYLGPFHIGEPQFSCSSIFRLPKIPERLIYNVTWTLMTSISSYLSNQFSVKDQLKFLDSWALRKYNTKNKHFDTILWLYCCGWQSRQTESSSCSFSVNLCYIILIIAVFNLPPIVIYYLRILSYIDCSKLITMSQSDNYFNK